MQYLLALYTDENYFAKLSPAEQTQTVAAYGAFYEALQKAGAYVASNRLSYAKTAATVRVNNGKTNVLDGPYADTKEQLGGFFLIDVPNLDAAISWAARCPSSSHGAVEVRPIWTDPA